MSILNGELYDALKEAGASDSSARKAAQSVATYDSRFAGIGVHLATLKGMAAFNLAATVAVLILMLWRRLS